MTITSSFLSLCNNMSHSIQKHSFIIMVFNTLYCGLTLLASKAMDILSETYSVFYTKHWNMNDSSLVYTSSQKCVFARSSSHSLGWVYMSERCPSNVSFVIFWKPNCLKNMVKRICFSQNSAALDIYTCVIQIQEFFWSSVK